MATAPPRQDPRTVVKTSERLWSEEVALAEAGDLVPAYPVAYRMSNGRVFVEKKPYGWVDDITA